MATYRVALLAAVCAVASDALQATGPKLASRARLRAANDAADDDAAGEPPKDAVEYVFGKPGEFERDMALLGTNPRRLLLFGSLALGIAGVGDLFGVTSALLTASPPPVKAFASKTRLDTYYLVGPLRRYVDDEFGFEVKYPRAWLGDQAVYVARTQNRARALATDPSGDAFIKAGRSRRGPAAVAAFGPAAGTFAENLSVFSAAVPGVSLAALGASLRNLHRRLLLKVAQVHVTARLNESHDGVAMAVGSGPVQRSPSPSIQLTARAVVLPTGRRCRLMRAL